MSSGPNSPSNIHIALDVMGGDAGPDVMLQGLRQARETGFDAEVTLHGRQADIEAALEAANITDRVPAIAPAEDVVTMEDKPTDALRRRRGSSMWQAIAQVKEGNAKAVVSSGNTGALMAMSVLQLRKIEGIDRPAIGALWPTVSSRCVVLDVGANVEVSANQLVQFAIMGEAYARALFGHDRPSVGLLNVGAEELKGHGLIQTAAKILREADPEMAFIGFVEGNDISKGVADVVVTDGFSGNIALKTAEGTARMVGGWVKDTLTANLRAKMGAALMMGALKDLKQKMNPSRANGAPLLGVNGLVIKSHGGADADGVAAALMTALALAKHPYLEEIQRTVAKVNRRVESGAVADLDGHDLAKAAQ
ncbi:fatty acid/phospholipid synthesis protein [Parvularcula bermudensis HTCC2503]|uniref:Phosphate acyltransferase n=1 Tax=Parvularcula bermudensis (strain ATCC BAA-594 / HTCC2503 / KCTC 12087) TaxID=314260 RepID=E0TBG7_PARBH|nr:phosphate acyltransferase PlsX [Parvularcula bermudensis]ADM08342.1 fatty acid/phospholipid synthesis protein [Parvularcula bermudensis HTCC2503]